MESMEKGLTALHCTKISADNSAENTLNLSANLSAQNWDFDEKRFRWASVVRISNDKEQL